MQYQIVLKHGSGFFTLNTFGRIAATCRSWGKIFQAEQTSWWKHGAQASFPRVLGIAEVLQCSPSELLELLKDQIRVKATAISGPVVMPEESAFDFVPALADYVFSLDLGFERGGDLSISGRAVWDADECACVLQNDILCDFLLQRNELQKVCLCVTRALQTRALYGIDPNEQLEIVSLSGVRAELLHEQEMSRMIDVDGARSWLPLRMVGKTYPYCDFDAYGDAVRGEGWGHVLKISWARGAIHFQAALTDGDGELVVMSVATLEKHLDFLFP